MKALLKTSICYIPKYSYRLVKDKISIGDEIVLVKIQHKKVNNWLFKYGNTDLGLLPKIDIPIVDKLFKAHNDVICVVEKGSNYVYDHVDVGVYLREDYKINKKNKNISDSKIKQKRKIELIQNKIVKPTEVKANELLTGYNDQKSNDIRNLYSIREGKYKILKNIGISNCYDLVNYDSNNIPLNCGITKEYIEKLKLYASSYINNKIIQLKPFNHTLENALFIDIETDIEPVSFSLKKIWCISILNDSDYHFLFANSWAEEFEILNNFLAYLKNHTNKSLISFSGTNFDQSILSKAIERHGLDINFFLSFKHTDICSVIKSSFIFPTQSYNLKDVGRLLSYHFKAAHIDGRTISLNYQRYIEKKATLSDDTFLKTEDDVRAIKHILLGLNKINNRNSLKLNIEFVPTTCWYKNVRSIVSPEQWDIIRKSVYKRANYVCDICGDRGKEHPVECHEIWEYDDIKQIQILKGFQALCPSCHEVKHLGRSELTGRGKVAHEWFMKINNLTEKEAKELILDARIQFYIRSQKSWTRNIDILIEFGIELNLLLQDKKKSAKQISSIRKFNAKPSH